MKYLVDTNVLLEYPEIFTAHPGDIFIIHTVVAGELDNQIHNERGNNELAYKARMARNAIKLAENIEPSCYMPHNRSVGLDHSVNDDILIDICVEKGLLLCTNDLAMQIKATTVNVKWIEYNGCGEELYKGYKRISGTTEFINNLFSNVENGEGEYKFVVNEYLIVDNTDTNETDEFRFNGEYFVDLKLPSSKIIKGLNPEQRCALDMLNNPEIQICGVLGNFGSGKTYLSLRMALHCVKDRGLYSKILAVREPISEGREVGYLSGTLLEKTEGFFKAIVQSLDGGEQELQSLMANGVLEQNIPYYMKGTTYDQTIIVVDEAEDLSEKQIQMIGTRLGSGSAISFCGDYKQAVKMANTNNPLVKMCKNLKGNPTFACIVLPEDVRSSVSKIFAELWD